MAGNILGLFKKSLRELRLAAEGVRAGRQVRRGNRGNSSRSSCQGHFKMRSLVGEAVLIITSPT